MDVFELAAKLSLNKSGFDQGLSQAKTSVESFASKVTRAFSNLASYASKIALGMGAAAATGVVGLTKQAVSAFADYEQLVGGIETLYGNADRTATDYYSDISAKVAKANELFGDFADQYGRNVDWSNTWIQSELAKQGKMTAAEQKKYIAELEEQYDSYGKYVRMTEADITAAAQQEYAAREKANAELVANAQNAWKTAGMSASEYLQTATGFSGALIRSLNGDMTKAAEVADRVMSDISDNANKFGIDVERVRYAYMGFARGTYIMLDNLNLGYGQTKTEMQRLIKDASELTHIQEELGVTVDANSLDFANIANAISVIQKKLGITGTTAKEAMYTIQGAARATKSAWQNVISAIAGGGDLDKAFEGLKTAVFGDGSVDKNGQAGGLVNLIIPRVQRTVSGISDFIQKVAPEIARVLPGLLDQIMPAMITATSSLINSLITMLPTFLSGIKNVLPQIVSGFSSMLPLLIQAGGDMFAAVVTGIEQASPSINNALYQAFGAIEAVLPGLGSDMAYVWEGLKDVFVWIKDNGAGVFKDVYEISKQLFNDFIKPIIPLLPGILDRIKGILDWAAENKQFVSDLLAIVVGLKLGTNGLKSILSMVKGIKGTLEIFGIGAGAAGGAGTAGTAGAAGAAGAASIAGTVAGVAIPVAGVAATATAPWWLDKPTTNIAESIKKDEKKYESAKKVYEWLFKDGNVLGTGIRWLGETSDKYKSWVDINVLGKDPEVVAKEAQENQYFYDALDEHKEKTSQNAIPKSIPETGEMSVTFADKWEEFKQNISAWFDDIKTRFADWLNGIPATITNVWNTITTTMSQWWQNLTQRFSEWISGIPEKFTTMWTGVKDWFGGIKQRFSDWIDRVKERFSEWKNAITEPFRNAYNTVIGWVNKLPDWVKNIFHIGGNVQIEGQAPSISWHAKSYDKPTIIGVGDRGNYKGGELVGGMDEVGGMITRAVNNGVGNGLNALSETVRKLIEVQNEYYISTTYSYVEIDNRLETKLDGVINAIKNLGAYLSGFIPASTNRIPVEWHAKSYDKPTIIGVGDRGSYKGGELVGGTDEIMGMITRAVRRTQPENREVRTFSQTDIVRAFEAALSHITVELDDETAGKFVRRTIEKALY